jgi:GGDEF domain-containing protein
VVIQRIALPIDIDGELLTVGISVGLALAQPGDAPATLLHNADVALYAAKNRGRGRFEVYQASQREGTIATEQDGQTAR